MMPLAVLRLSASANTTPSENDPIIIATKASVYALGMVFLMSSLLQNIGKINDWIY